MKRFFILIFSCFILSQAQIFAQDNPTLLQELKKRLEVMQELVKLKIQLKEKEKKILALQDKLQAKEKELAELQTFLKKTFLPEFDKAAKKIVPEKQIEPKKEKYMKIEKTEKKTDSNTTEKNPTQQVKPEVISDLIGFNFNKPSFGFTFEFVQK